MKKKKILKREIGCDKCGLVKGYAGAVFEKIKSEKICNFCKKFKKQKFLGKAGLIKDLSLNRNEKIGVTVSGGKDSLYVWMWLVKNFGHNRVIAFNHRKIGLTHPLAEENLKKAEKRLNSKLIILKDYEFLPRFKNNLYALLSKPDPAMVRVALCAGCRMGISGRLFEKAREFGITKIINGASYLELAPFKGKLMRIKGNGIEKRGLLCGLLENPLYYFPENITTIMMDDEHCHAEHLDEGKSKKNYPEITYLDFYRYFPNIPEKIEKEVKNKLGWEKSKQGSWHFDCLVEPFKNLFYYGLLGYTETDFNLSQMVRYKLITKEQALTKLYSERQKIIQEKNDIFELLKKINCNKLLPQIKKFIDKSKYL